MALTIALLDVIIDANTQGLRRGLQQSQGNITAFSRSVGGSLKSLGALMTLGVTLPIVAGFGLAARAAIDFEDAFAGVRKTVDGTEEELQALSAELRALAVNAEAPVSSLKNAAIELVKIGEIAGQLGIGIDNIAEFSEVIGELAMSTNLLAGDAALQLAQFLNVTGTDPSAIRDVGNAIVALGNNFATTEDKIADVAKRFGAAGTLARLSAGEILGLATAASQLGIRSATAGGRLSTFAKVIVEAAAKGGTELDALARAAGVTGKVFQEAFAEDASDAILLFLEGLGGLDAAAQFGVLDDIGLSSSRATILMLGLAASVDDVRRAMELGNDEFIGGNALQEEAAKRAETTQSAINRLKNNFNELAITVGDRLLPKINTFIEFVTGIVKKLAKVNPQVLDLALAFGAILATVGPILFFGGVIIGTFGVVGVAAAALAAIIAVNFDSIKNAILNGIGPEGMQALTDIREAITGFISDISGEEAVVFNVSNFTVPFTESHRTQLKTFTAEAGDTIIDLLTNDPDVQAAIDAGTANFGDLLEEGLAQVAGKGQNLQIGQNITFTLAEGGFELTEAN